MFNNLIRKIIQCTVIGLLTGCALNPTTGISITVPAESTEAARAKALAVLPFEGFEGRDLSTDIEGMLASVKVEGRPFFRVIERNQLERALREIRLSQSGGVSQAQAKALGRTLGISAFYIGSVDYPIVDYKTYQEERYKCHDDFRLKDIFKKCKNSTTTIVSCEKTDVAYSFTPILIDANSAEIIFSNVVNGNATESSCQDRTTPAKSTSDLLQVAKKMALANFLTKVAPSDQKLNVSLMADLDDITSEVVKQKLMQGIEFAEAGRLDRACTFWNEARELGPDAKAVLFNLAICAESARNYDAAIEMYRKAERLLDKPDPRISEALMRIETIKSNSRKLKQQIKS